MDDRSGRTIRFWTYLWLLLPVVLMLGFIVAAESIGSISSNAWGRAFLLAGIGVVGVIVILVVIRLVTKHLGLTAPDLKPWWSVFIGLAIGLVLSVACGLVFFGVHGTDAGVSFGEAMRWSGLVSNLNPALIEEASMRAGVVHLLTAFHGPWAGLAGGSLPFGLLHLFGKVFGNPEGITHVLGTTMSGLLLSILYLKFGFWAAFGCHWVWNSLAGVWVRYAGLTSKGGAQMLEGSVWTILILVVACVALIGLGDKGWMRRGIGISKPVFHS